VETAMLQTWFQVQESNAQSAANSLRVREIAYRLLEENSAALPNLSAADTVSDATVPAAALENSVKASPATHSDLRHELSPIMSSHHYIGYILTDKDRRICSASSPELLHRVGVPELESLFVKTLEGETTVCPPFLSVDAIKDDTGKIRTGVPNMFVAAPIRDERFQIVGVLAFQFRPELKFTEILQLGRMGETGETYAFDTKGQMISNSRFDNDLILAGLLPDRPGSRSLLNIDLRDPGVDMTQGLRSTLRRSEQPMTEMVTSAVAGNSGVRVLPYRDYRGVRVVGAWNWLSKYDMGLATEVDYAEAFRPLTILQWTFSGLFVLLGASSVAIFVFTVIVARLQREAQKAAVEAKQLGQYELEEKLGAGGMGVVYKAHHAMLRRPTAVKMLDIDKVNEASTARFEREVQITCQLNHPNTIAIYDFGRTPEGVFYYAMEYLDGIDLQQLVDRYGPQNEARIIRILLQVCGSLYEAHSRGLVHRDIKPSNIMVNRRGNEPDVVKVLDFGLVKALDDDKNAGMTANASLTGTPLYMSPEAIQSPLAVDNRSDLYAVGAVGYYLLTGQPVFMATNIVELCKHHVDTVPVPPSQRSGRVISSDLEDVVLACLEKNRAKRPQTARDLASMLMRCVDAPNWSMEDADGWWTRHERGLPAAQVNAMPGAMSMARNVNGPTTPAPLSSPGRNTPVPGSQPTTAANPEISRFDQTMISGEFE
jgi:serine/threonine protein kinase